MREIAHFHESAKMYTRENIYVHSIFFSILNAIFQTHEPKAIVFMKNNMIIINVIPFSFI